MGVQVAGKPDGKNFIQHIVLITSSILLPGLDSTLLGWAYFIFPLVALFYLNRLGSYLGGKYIVSSTLLALMVSIFLKTVPQALSSVVLMPACYTLYECARKGEGVNSSGLKTIVTILLSWVAFLFFFPHGNVVTPISLPIQSLDNFIVSQETLFRTDSNLSTDKLALIEESFNALKLVILKIRPSLYINWSIFITWIVMAIGNHILFLYDSRKLWPDIQCWQLPEKIIWLFISSVILLLMAPGETAIFLSINVLIVICFLYCLQGFSIVIHFFNKWGLPRLVRSLFYVMIFLQPPGQLILLGLGLLNTWIDFRKNKLTEQDDSQYDNDE